MTNFNNAALSNDEQNNVEGGLFFFSRLFSWKRSFYYRRSYSYGGGCNCGCRNYGW